MAQGTLLPTPIFTAWNANGTISDGAIATFYIAGTTTLTPIYADVNLTTQLANPLTADGSGRFPEIFLVPGQSYKMKLTDKNLVALDGYPADNILAVPVSADTLDVTGTAGEALTAGQVVYLSDGSGSKTAGLWYKADSANAYSSTTNEIGMVPTSIASGSSGSIRQGGSLTGLTVAVGSLYYVGTAGAITATQPAANSRVVGQADTSTSLILGAPPPLVPLDNSVCDGRLTLTAGTPVTIADVTGATSVYFSPYRGNRISLYDGSVKWNERTFTETTLALGSVVTGQAYDVFGYDNSGVLALEKLEWASAVVTVTIATPAVVTWTTHGLVTGNSMTFTTTSALPTGLTANTQYWVTVLDVNTFNVSTSPKNVVGSTLIATSGSQSGTHTGHQPQARATALTLQDGVLVKTGDTTRRFLGTILATSATATEDSITKRYVSNYYNRMPRELQRYESTTSWTYTTATVRQAHDEPLNQVEFVSAYQEAPMDLTLSISASGNTDISAGIGEDSTNTYVAGQTVFVNSSGSAITVRLVKVPTVGRHFYSWNEWSTASGTTTWNGATSGKGSSITSGLSGWILG